MGCLKFVFPMVEALLSGASRDHEGYFYEAPDALELHGPTASSHA